MCSSSVQQTRAYWKEERGVECGASRPVCCAYRETKLFPRIPLRSVTRLIKRTAGNPGVKATPILLMVALSCTSTDRIHMFTLQQERMLLVWAGVIQLKDADSATCITHTQYAVPLYRHVKEPVTRYLYKCMCGVQVSSIGVAVNVPTPPAGSAPSSVSIGVAVNVPTLIATASILFFTPPECLRK